MNPGNAILTALDIRKDETPTIVLLMLYSFFMGLATAFFFTTSISTFLTNFDSEMLLYTYIVSGCLSYILWIFYARVEKKLKFSTVLILGVLFLLVTVSVLFVCQIYSDSKWLSFLMLVWVTAFMYISSVSFWGLAAKLFDIRQGKRLFSLISSGEVVSSVIGFLSIPLLLQFIRPSYLLIVSIVGLAFCLLIIGIIIKKFRPKLAVRVRKKQKETQSEGSGGFFSNRYYLLIFIMAALPMIGFYYIDYLFFDLTKDHYFEDEKGLTKFIGYFFGAVNFVELFIKLFLFSRVLSQFGLMVGLLALPVSLAFTTALAVVIGKVEGVEAALFFAIIAMSKLFERVMRSGINIPIFRILYQPIPDDERMAFQSKVEGVPNSIGHILAGVILLAFAFAGLKDPVFLNFILLFILAYWIVVSVKLFRAYKEKLQQVLISNSDTDDIERELFGMDVLTRQLSLPPDSYRDGQAGATNARYQHASIMLLNEVNPSAIEPFAKELLTHDNTGTRKLALHSIPTDHNDPELISIVSKIAQEDKDTELQLLAIQILKRLKQTDIQPSNITPPQYSEQQGDTTILDQHSALNMAKKNSEEMLPLLHKTKQNILSVRMDYPMLIVPGLSKNNANIIINVAKDYEEIKDDMTQKSQMIEQLLTPAHMNSNSDFLIDYGDETIHELQVIFEKSKSPRVCSKIIELYAKIGTPATQKMLLGKLNYSNREVQIDSIRALHFMKYQVGEEERPIIKNKIEDLASTITWLNACLNDVSPEANTKDLINALEKENEEYFELLFMLLGFIYNPSSINLIKENLLDTKNKEGTIFALELIDNFIEADIKPLIFPLCEDISISNRLKKLQHTFPQRNLSLEDRLKDIINRDYAKTAIWTKANAIHVLGEIVGNGMPNEIVACLYHLHPLLHETAARIIFNKSPDDLHAYFKGLSREKVKHFEVVFEDEDVTHELLFDKVKILKNIPVFSGIPEQKLIELAGLFRSEHVPESGRVFLNKSKTEESVHIIASGTMSIYFNENFNIDFINNRIFIDEANSDNGLDYMIAEADSLILISGKAEFFDLMVDHVDLTKSIQATLAKVAA